MGVGNTGRDDNTSTYVRYRCLSKTDEITFVNNSFLAHKPHTNIYEFRQQNTIKTKRE